MAATVFPAWQISILDTVTPNGRAVNNARLVGDYGLEEENYTYGEQYDLFRWKQGVTTQPEWYPKG